MKKKGSDFYVCYSDSVDFFGRTYFSLFFLTFYFGR